MAAKNRTPQPAAEQTPHEQDPTEQGPETTEAPAPQAEQTHLAGREQKLVAVRASGDKNRLHGRDQRAIWFDARATGPAGQVQPDDALVERVLLGGLYTGIIVDAAQVESWREAVPPRFDLMIDASGASAQLDDALSTASALSAQRADDQGRVAVASSDEKALARVRAQGVRSCLLAHVDDRDTLHGSIQAGTGHDYLVVSFRDPTNIPLELVIATLQATDTVLVKQIAAGDVDDAVVTLGVMEVGADGVMFTPSGQGEYDQLTTRLQSRQQERLEIEPATVVRSEPVGMGYRACLDLATMFSETEGMVVGSTSQGGVLCCAEVFFLPYMELRPFRVNAGAVHSYVYNAEDRTDYMSELRAGSSVLVVGTDGTARRAPVGRVKTEVRPLRLIEVEFAGGDRVNVLMQDDWHVRIFSADSKPLNITTLKPGDRVLGHRATPGRHVGISVDENIIER